MSGMIRPPPFSYLASQIWGLDYGSLGRLILLILDRHIWEAIRRVWPEAHWPGEQPVTGIESRL